MGKQPTIFFFGVLFCIGLMVQILSSVYWKNIPNEKLGEMIFYLGQDIGELCYIFACRKLFKGLGFFVAVTEFAISLVLVDIYTITVLDPLEITLSKYLGFAIGVVVLMVRLNSYKKQHE